MYSSRIWVYLSLTLAAFSGATPELEDRQIDGTISAVISTPLAAAITSSTSSLPQINADTTTTTSSSSSSIIDITTKATPAFTPPLSNLTTTTSSTSSTTSTTPTSTTSTSISTTAITTGSVTTIPRSTVIIVVTTDGSTYTSSSTSYSTSTASGVAAASSDSSTPSGMDPRTRSTIIGATVGIGGSILLAGLIFVAWRLWGKRAPRMDEDEILMAGSNAHGEKLTGSSGSQFKSTLDQYHAHSGTNF